MGVTVAPLLTAGVTDHIVGERAAVFLLIAGVAGAVVLLMRIRRLVSMLFVAIAAVILGLDGLGIHAASILGGMPRFDWDAILQWITQSMTRL